MREAQLIPTHSAVSVKPHGTEACQSVQDINGQRFLCSEAPTLPLESCDRYDQCKCKYEKWDDRRQEDRRYFGAGIANQFYHEEEKRSQHPGRRSTD